MNLVALYFSGTGNTKYVQPSLKIIWIVIYTQSKMM